MRSAKSSHADGIQSANRFPGIACSYFNLKSVWVIFFLPAMLIIHVTCVILKCCFSNIPLWNDFIGSGAAGFLLFYFMV